MIREEPERTLSWQAGWRKKPRPEMTSDELERIRSEEKRRLDRLRSDPTWVRARRERDRRRWQNMPSEKKAAIADIKHHYAKKRRQMMTAADKEEQNAYVRAWRNASEDRAEAIRKNNREWYAKRNADQKRRKNEIEKARLAARDAERKKRDRAVKAEWKHANRQVSRRANRKRKIAARAAGNFTAQEWAKLVAQNNHRCLRCGKREPEIVLTVDHVVPLSKGGANTIDNLQPLCGPCNSKKGTSIIRYGVLSAA